MGKRKKKSSWEWYAIKLLFESTIWGEPDKNKLDENYSDGYKLYEEQIVVVKAQSPNHACKLAELGAKKNEMTYNNPYGQTVQCKFIDAVNCQRLFDGQIKSGTEVYSVLFKEPANVETLTVIETHFPETLYCAESGKVTPFYNFLIS